MKNLILLFVCTFLIFSCKKEEEPVLPGSPEEEVNDSSTIVEVDIFSGYPKQAFFSLNTFTEVQRNSKDDWDLGARFVNGEPHIFMNYARYMLAGPSSSDFQNTTSETGIDLQWDKPEGRIEDFRIGSTLNTTYVIDMGYDENKEALGFMKMQLIKEGDKYKVKSAKLDNSQENVVTISPVADKEFVTISLDGSPKSEVYPKDDEWDLLITNYTTQFDPQTPYLVSGVLINHPQIQVAFDSTYTFGDLNINDVDGMSFSSDADKIGFDWKEYFFDAGYYVVNTELNYIIRRENNYYKLRFLDFYNEVGETGNFKFEIQKL